MSQLNTIDTHLDIKSEAFDKKVDEFACEPNLKAGDFNVDPNYGASDMKLEKNFKAGRIFMM